MRSWKHSRHPQGVVVAPLALAACATSIAETPAQRLYAAQGEFNAYGRVVLAYVRLPECVPEAITACSRPAIKARLKEMTRIAKSALDAGQVALATPGARSGAGARVAMAVAAVVDIARYIATKEIGK